TAVTTALARLHVTGTPVDWSAWFTRDGHHPGTLDLPTYAFRHRRYWLADQDTPSTGGGEADDGRFWDAVERADLTALDPGFRTDQPVADLLPALARWRHAGRRRAASDSWRYRVDWQPVPETTAGLTGTWLLLLPYLGIDDAIVAAVTDGMTAAGATVRPVPLDGPAGDRELIAKALRDSDGTAGVVSLLALGGADAGAVLATVQAAAEAGLPGPLWWLTRGAVAVGAADAPVDPVAAGTWGLGRVAGLEEPGRWGGLVDLPAEVDARTVRRVCGVLAGGGEDQVAVRPSG
ncbi:hypothetical protein, partial [Micromonospora sp. NBS 11-29]|uniref:hypothetical protein n=1 Tax=Micromonospora sp. NBS 11-29 TaxID=1960879 RepID=UPI001C38D5B9